MPNRYHEYLLSVLYGLWGALVGNIFAIVVSPQIISLVYQLIGGLITAVVSTVAAHLVKKYLKLWHGDKSKDRE